MPAKNANSKRCFRFRRSYNQGLRPVQGQALTKLTLEGILLRVAAVPDEHMIPVGDGIE